MQITKKQLTQIINHLTDHPLRDGGMLLDRCKAARKAGPDSAEWASLVTDEGDVLEHILRKAGK